MIFDVIVQSLKGSQVVIPLEKLLGTSDGSRMPDVRPDLLTSTIAAQVVSACPTGALSTVESESGVVLTLDYGECVGCGHCYSPSDGALFPAKRLSCCGGGRAGLIRRWDVERQNELSVDESLLEPTGREIRAIIGRALNIRQLDAGSCNGCEAEISALSNPYYDLERFGIHFVASPKHADMLLVTGPVTRNMVEAVKSTYEATPAPKLVVAVGACGVSGGIFGGSHAVVGPVDAVIPVDAYIPGCPPTPAMLLTGILRTLRLRKI
jgi:Ni,Fe-hydrogenase III small subunit/NAD-dependent dihydropyrimidine dehydrogenase PreA subunit